MITHAHQVEFVQKVGFQYNLYVLSCGFRDFSGFIEAENKAEISENRPKN